MSKFDKVIAKILKGFSDKNIDFADLSYLLSKLGFEERIKGSHHIYTKEGVEEIINIQPTSENKAKPYQVKQIRDLIIQYQFTKSYKNDENT
jgi:predicted RNA binding protein YcfA (HicA-like mRNA interferase family)